MTDVVIPVKDLRQAKGRLRDVLTPGERSGLVLAMLHDVLTTLQRCELGDIWLVASDDAVFDLGAGFGTRMLRETSPLGYNAAVAFGLDAVPEESPVIILPGDVPHVRPQDIDRLTADPIATGEVRIVADHLGTGTNALFLSRPDLIAPNFGANSLQDHMTAGIHTGLQARKLSSPGLVRDIDVPEDLIDLANAPSGGAAAEFLRSCALDWQAIHQTTRGAA